MITDTGLPARLDRRADGYRYIRSYTVEHDSITRYALWERREGKMRRIGTAWSEEQSRDFLRGEP